MAAARRRETPGDRLSRLKREQQELIEFGAAEPAARGLVASLLTGRPLSSNLPGQEDVGLVSHPDGSYGIAHVFGPGGAAPAPRAVGTFGPAGTTSAAAGAGAGVAPAAGPGAPGETK